MLEKLVTTEVRDPNTGEITRITKKVFIEDSKDLERIREAREAALNAEAEAEAIATYRHRAIRPNVQKLGWKR